MTHAIHAEDLYQFKDFEQSCELVRPIEQADQVRVDNKIQRNRELDSAFRSVILYERKMSRKRVSNLLFGYDRIDTTSDFIMSQFLGPLFIALSLISLCFVIFFIAKAYYILLIPAGFMFFVFSILSFTAIHVRRKIKSAWKEAHIRSQG